MTGGTDTETDEQLRARILQRIQNPPMGGSAADYVAWALAVPGVTRAWAAPEQGIGTITVRFLMDDLRADDDGWPTPADVADGRALHRPEAAGHGHGLLRARADQAVHRHHHRQPGAGHDGSAGRDRGEPAGHAAADGGAGTDDLRGVGFLRDHECAERAVVSAGDDRRLCDAVAGSHGGARDDPLPHERSAYPQVGSDYTEAFLVDAAARAGLAEARARQRAGADRRRACATIGASSMAAPPICSRAKAIRVSPSSCCPTGNATGVCPIPATRRRRPSTNVSLRWSCG